VVRRLEPGFTIEFLEGTLAHYVDVVRRALEPASARILAIHSGSVKLEELAEVVVRLGISAFFMQSERAGELPDIFARVLKDSTRPHRATTRRAIASG
jgi:hypothetical protein